MVVAAARTALAVITARICYNGISSHSVESSLDLSKPSCCELKYELMEMNVQCGLMQSLGASLFPSGLASDCPSRATDPTANAAAMKTMRFENCIVL
jgi:hypothetical protein